MPFIRSVEMVCSLGYVSHYLFTLGHKRESQITFTGYS